MPVCLPELLGVLGFALALASLLWQAWTHYDARRDRVAAQLLISCPPGVRAVNAVARALSPSVEVKQDMLQGMDKREIVRLLRICINATGAPKPGPVKKPLKIWSSQGVSVIISGREGTRAFNGLLKRAQAGCVQGKPIEKVYARSTLEAKAEHLISKVLNHHGRFATEDELTSAVEEWFQGFHADFPEGSFYVPVANLKLGEELTIGRVTFRPLSPELAGALIGPYCVALDRGEAPEEQKRRWKQYAEELFRPADSDSAAEVRLAADPALGYERCLRYTEDALNVLRYYGGFLYSPSQRAHVAARGRLSRGHLGVVFLIADKRWGMSARLTGPLLTYDLSGENLGMLKEWGLDLLSKLLAEEPTNEVEAAVLSAVEWSGRASQSLEPEARFLNLWIAVETLLTCEDDKKRDETQGQLIAQRASLILRLTEKERERVRNLWNEKLYKVRCHLVHRGRSEELGAYLPMLEIYAARVIMSCIDNLKAGNSWPTKTEFFSWLEALH